MADSSGARHLGPPTAEGLPSEPPRPPRFPAFDGLRALAAGLVIGVHTSFVSGVTTSQHWGLYTSRLDIGVLVFFLISGFLLYRPFVAAHLLGVDRPRTGAFWLRRLLRILPAYWVALFLITSVFHLSPIGPNGWRAYVAHYLFLQTYFTSQQYSGITQAWSLCVEMSFYLFVPLYAMAIGWRRSKRSLNGRLIVELSGLVVMCIISALWRSYFIYNTKAFATSSPLELAWLPAYLDVFAAGMFLAVMSAWTHQRNAEPKFLKSRVMPWASWAIAIVCFYVVAHVGISLKPIYTETFRDGVRQELYALFAFFVLVPAVFGPQDQTLIRRLLRCWPVASLGAVSYGVYLWHQAVIAQLLKSFNLRLFHIPFWPFFFSVLGLSTAIATISYFTIERPALKLKNSLSWFRGRTNFLANSASDPNDPSA